MADENDLRNRIENILSGSARQKLFAARKAQPAGRRFSAFVGEDMARASSIAAELIEIAAKKGGEEGIADAVASVEARLGSERPGLLEYAVKLFVTHYPEARDRFKLPPLEKRRAPSPPPAKEENLGAAAVAVAPAANWGVATPPEDRVSYWRQDPLLNEHHEHWHLVYPFNPVPPQGLGDRHGELFGYMHEQMIARYDAERLAAGLPRLEAFTDLRAAIPQGYDPGPLKLWADGGGWSSYRARPAGATISDLVKVFSNRPGALIANQERFRDQLVQVAKDGKFVVPGKGDIPADIDRFGASVEASVGAPDFFAAGDPKNYTYYGNLHNDGHIHLMAFDDDPAEPFGVMADTTTAVRDPVFFRWHKLVDNVYFAWQEQQAPNDFADAPPVRAAGIHVVPTASLPPNLDAAALDVSALKSVDELATEMLTRTITASPDDPPPIPPVDYVTHEDFVYLIQAENSEPAPQRVTVRIFLAPEIELEDRRAWIEMDRFSYQFEANERALIVRKSEDSSVVRKPALKPEDLTPDDEPGAKTDLQSWCDCGWPYTMLLPRGTREGMAFRLMVMFSPGGDMVMPKEPGKCTSISYCGLESALYPDKRPMGYPFSRRFAKPIPETIASQPNMAAQTITIREK